MGKKELETANTDDSLKRFCSKEERGLIGGRYPVSPGCVRETADISMLVGMVHDKAEKGEACWDAGAGDEAGRRAHSNRKAECLGWTVGECANCPWKSLLTSISQWTRKQGHQLGATVEGGGKQAQEETEPKL